MFSRGRAARYMMRESRTGESLPRTMNKEDDDHAYIIVQYPERWQFPLRRHRHSNFPGRLPASPGAIHIFLGATAGTRTGTPSRTTAGFQDRFLTDLDHGAKKNTKTPSIRLTSRPPRGQRIFHYDGTTALRTVRMRCHKPTTDRPAAIMLPAMPHR